MFCRPRWWLRLRDSCCWVPKGRGGESEGRVAWVGFLVNGERFRFGSARLLFVVHPTDPLGVDERVATCFDGGHLHVTEDRPGAEELDVHLIIQ